MTDRERLIELKINFVENFDCGDCKPSNNKCRKCLSEKEADYFLEHGIIVPPCKLGDIVYTTHHGSLSVYRVTEFIVNDFLWAELFNSDYSDEYKFTFVCLDFSFNKFVFLTREEAEKALKERESNAE